METLKAMGVLTPIPFISEPSKESLALGKGPFLLGLCYKKSWNFTLLFYRRIEIRTDGGVLCGEAGFRVKEKL